LLQVDMPSMSEKEKGVEYVRLVFIIVYLS